MTTPVVVEPLPARRRRDWTGFALRIAEIVLIVALGLTLTGSDHARTSQDNRSDRLAACRSLYNSDKETARTVAADALNERDKVQTLALVALANDEQAQFVDITKNQLQPKIDAENEAVAGLDRATLDYAAASLLSVSDPEAFLMNCNARAGTGGS